YEVFTGLEFRRVLFRSLGIELAHELEGVDDTGHRSGHRPGDVQPRLVVGAPGDAHELAHVPAAPVAPVLLVLEGDAPADVGQFLGDRKSTRLYSRHVKS